MCIQELCERLWDISDKHKEKHEQERTVLMGNGWSEEHIAVLINYHSKLIQVMSIFWFMTLVWVRFWQKNHNLQFLCYIGGVGSFPEDTLYSQSLLFKHVQSGVA